MTQWQQAWRQLAKSLPVTGLEALSEACRADDPRLVTGSFIRYDECGCAIGFAVLKSRGWPSIDNARLAVEDLFLDACGLNVAHPSPTAFTMKFDNEMCHPGPHRTAFLKEFRPEVDRAIVMQKLTPLFQDAVTLDEWMDTANTAFSGLTPMQELDINGRERLEAMIYHIESGVAS